MAYEIHFERPGGVPLEAWLDAVDAHAGVRRAEAPGRAVNPATGEVIELAPSPGDAEALLGGSWWPAFRWHAERVSFSASRGFPQDELQALVRALAASLSCDLVGDEGESY